MDQTTINNVVDTRGYAFLTQAQKDVYNKTPTPKSSEVGMVSSETGLNLLNGAKKTEAKLAPPPPPTSTTTPPTSTATSLAPAPSTTSTTPSGNLTFQEAIDLFGHDFIGVHQNTDGTYTPDTTALSRLGIKTSPTVVTPEQQRLKDARTEVDTLTTKLVSLDVSNDPVLTNTLNGISSQWEARIKEMERIGTSRVAALSTTAIRSGSRYTGGMGGVYGGIISEEERQGVERIAALQAQKNDALNQARSAYEIQQWNKYVQLITLAEKKYADVYQEVSDLNKAVAEKTKADAEIKKAQDAVIAKTKSDVLLSIGKHNAPPAVVDAVSASTTEADMVKAAGTYLEDIPSGGIVSEYLFYKKQAELAKQVPLDFNAYQNLDANRKAKATANANGETVSNLSQQLVDGLLAPSELSKRASGANSYNDILVAADKYSMLKYGKHFNIAQADRDYKYAQRPQTQDTLNYLGSLIGSIDPSTGLPTGGNLTDLLDKSNLISRTNFPALNSAKYYALIQTGDPDVVAYLTTVTEVSDQIAKILQGGGTGSGTSDAKLRQATALFNTGFSKNQVAATVNAIMPLLANRAKSMISNNPYLSDYADQFGFSGKPTTTQTIIQTEKQAESSLKNFSTSNPGKVSEMSTRIKTMEQSLGRPISSQEFLQAFPEYK